MNFTREELHYARVKFQLLVHQSDGQSYENLFVQVMTRRWPDFKPIKPHGSSGDRKNDGYDAPRGSYYQVYAPEDSNKSVPKAAKKAAEDFAGLLKYWQKISRIREYRFVFNDKFRGPYPEVEARLTALGKTHRINVCEVFLAKDLLRTFGELDQQEAMDIVGLVPNPARIQLMDFAIFGEVLNYVLRNTVTWGENSLLYVPDFEEKIKFNGLSREVGALLTHGSFQAGTVRQFFESDGRVSSTAIRDKLAAIYESKKSQGKPNDSATSGSDVIFFEILGEIVPQKTPVFQNAALVLMAYFFESCDIFEPPVLI